VHISMRSGSARCRQGRLGRGRCNAAGQQCTCAWGGWRVLCTGVAVPYCSALPCWSNIAQHRQHTQVCGPADAAPEPCSKALFGLQLGSCAKPWARPCLAQSLVHAQSLEQGLVWLNAWYMRKTL